MRIICFLFTIFFVSITHLVFSQKSDYIVTVKNDTIYGKLKYSLVGGKVRLQTKDTSINCLDTTVRLFYKSSSDITTAYAKPIEWKNYISLMREDTGRITTYSFSSSAGNTTVTTYFAQKGNGQIFELRATGLVNSESDKKHARFCDLFEGNEEFTRRCADMKYKIKNILALIKEYNALAMQENNNQQVSGLQ